FFLSEDAIEGSSGYYRPLTYISFALEQAIWGKNPAGYHCTNLLLHILVTMLFYAVTAALFKKERLALIAALVFALHPVAGESVNFLSGGRNTLLSACFGLLSFLFYIRQKNRAALVSFSFAIFSKEFALLLPAIFMFYDLRLQREKLRLSRYLPFLIPIAAYLSLRAYVVQKANFLASMNLADAMAAPYLVARYVLNMLLPLQLKLLYSINPTTTSGIICLAILGILAAAIYYFRAPNEILFSAFWVLLFLLPVINIIPLHTTTVMADRYAYFSLMGFSLLLATLICTLSERHMMAGAAVLCAAYAFVDFRHNGFWKNEVIFFTRMTQDAPERFEGYKNLGLYHYKNGDIDRAILNLEAADAKPGIPVKFLIGDAYIFWKENRLEQAEKTLLRVVDLNPSNPEPYLLLMMIYEQRGDESAAQLYRNKLRNLVDGIDEIMTNRTIELCRAGETYLSKRQYTDAEVYLWQALRINPAFIPALIDMGSLKSERGDLAGAITYLTKAIALEPSNRSAHYNLAMVYRMQGRSAEAQQELARFTEMEAGVQQKKGSPSR
ncbi:MAG TPA: tetratricopeptide repeat protein, partial [Geobacteraceae bacterium]|nr:tetratricopeptide repeat protein [Geobacteraceae bacterium]